MQLHEKVFVLTVFGDCFVSKLWFFWAPLTLTRYPPTQPLLLDLEGFVAIVSLGVLGLTLQKQRPSRKGRRRRKQMNRCMQFAAAPSFERLLVLSADHGAEALRGPGFGTMVVGQSTLHGWQS